MSSVSQVRASGVYCVLSKNIHLTTGPAVGADVDDCM